MRKGDVSTEWLCNDIVFQKDVTLLVFYGILKDNPIHN